MTENRLIDYLSHMLNAALRSDDCHLLLARELPRLREIGVPGEPVSRAEQCLNMLLREMNVVRRDFNRKRLSAPGLERPHDTASRHRLKRLARQHSFLIGRDDQHRNLRVVGRDATDFLESSRIAVPFTIEDHPHAFQSLHR